LESRQAMLTSFISAKDGVSPEEAAGRLSTALGALKLFDRLEVNQKGLPSQLTFLIRLRTNQPLRK
jgi:hypothetical protein